MKIKFFASSRLLLLAAISFLYLPGSAQLSGSYTINPSQSASNTNYTNWASAVSDLVSGSRSDGGTAQGPGVGGAVTITVFDTIYNTQVEIGAINGTSSSNTVTFKSNGGDSSTCVLRYASTGASNTDFVLLLNGCDYVTFQEIGFERTGTNTYSTAVQLSGDADYNRFIRCRMIARKMPSNSSLGFQYGIGSCIYFTGNADYTEITNCRLTYGYNGVYGTQSCTGNKIYGNQIDTSGSAGIYMTSQTGLEIVGNTFNIGDFGPNQGHYTSYGFRIETSPSMFISGNKVYMTAKNAQVCRAAIIASTTSTAASPSLLINNFIMNDGGTGDCTGLAVYGCNYLDFYSNNVLITNSLNAGAAYYHYGNYTNSYINLVNNNLVNKGGGFTISVPGTNTGDLDKVDHNNLFTTGSYIGKWSGTDYSNFTSWKSASGKDSNSVNLDPGYVSNLDLHVSNVGINGKGLPYSAVTIDIDGDTRDTSSPDIGADEFFPATLDAGISNIDSPSVFCAGTHPVKVSFTNYGTDTITSLQIDWHINGGTQNTYSWSGSVAPGTSSSSIALGNHTFASNTAYTFKIWSRNPNGGSDGKTLNDTLIQVRYAGLTGTYTIGDTSIADYKSFNDAITDMTARGICGAVTFNVYPGVYNEQITLVQLSGMGASRPLVFQNMNADSTLVRVSLPSTTATGNNNAAIQLRGADYVSFRRITFERTGTNPYGHVVHILNGATNNTFQSCQMRGLYTGSANANAVNIWSDQGVDHNNAFIGNYVCQGNVSMLYTGTSTESETGTVIEGNVFDSAYANTVQISYNKGVVIRGNTFGNISYVTTGTFDVQLNFCDSNIRVVENRFSGTNTNIAVHLVGCLAGSSYPGIIANNFITKGNGKGILLEGVQQQKIYYNSLNFTQNNAANTGIEVTNAGSSGIEFKNNIITMAAGYVFNVDGPTQIDASDYNNLYTTGSTFAIWGTSSYSSLAAFQATGIDSHSLAVNPIYYSSVNLHVKSPDLKGKGTALSAVMTDIDGQQRHSTNPDIGADEFELLPNDAGIIAIVNPGTGGCSGSHPVKTLLKNFGRDTLKNVSIEWSIGGVSQTTYSWTGNLVTNATDTVTLSTAYPFSGGTIVIFAKTLSPNGQNDEIGYNDSTRLNLQIFNSPPKNAGPDKILCLGDSILIGGNSISGYSYSWTDMANNQLGTSAQIYVNTTNSGSYIVKLTNNSTGCTSLDTMELTVLPKPTLNAGVDRLLCSGFSTSIGESTPQSGHTYQWTSQPAGFSSINSLVTVSPSITTSYILRKTNISSGCFIIDTVSITVVPKQTPQLLGPNNVCLTDTVSFSTSVVSGASYTWTANGADITSGQQTANVSVSWKNSGTHTLMLVVVGSQGCADTAIKNINAMIKPDAQMLVDGSCAGEQISFSDQSTNGGNRTWSFGDGGTSILANTSHVYTQAGNYQVILVSRSGMCYDTAMQLISVVDPPVANFYTGPACAGANTDFYDSSSSAVEWFWDFGGDTSSQAFPSHVFSASGTFVVKLRVTGSTGCVDSLTQFVTVNPLPNADFTYQVNSDTLSLSPIDTTGVHYWDFGDGQNSNDKFPVHRYTQVPKWVWISHSITGSNGCSNQFADSVFVGPNALNPVFGRMDIQVYPNPFRAELIVKFDLNQAGVVSIRLYDASGRELLLTAPRIFEPGQSEINIDTWEMNLAPGLYFIEVDADGVSGGQRVVKVE
ncbi:MAG TPA: hypothetical protein DIW47_13750 [Bacteroidetes bacterium]|nr:hypothetical protein [Bacteroidota bacterium]